MKVGVHSLTHNPTAAWRELSQEQKVIKINAKVPTSDAPNDKVDLRYITILLFQFIISNDKTLFISAACSLYE